MSIISGGIRRLTILVSLGLASQAALAFPSEVVLLRHAEKPAKGPELSSQGWQRAQALPQLFLNRPEFKRFGPPADLYAMKQEKPGGSIRAEQTLKYVAQSFGLPIRMPFTRYETQALTEELRTRHDLDGKQVVVCWEHNQLSDLAEALGVKPTPEYPDDRFDRAWIVDFDSQGGVLGFQDLPQRLLEGDDRQ